MQTERIAAVRYLLAGVLMSFSTMPNEVFLR
jgi:hypothetical protein